MRWKGLCMLIRHKNGKILLLSCIFSCFFLLGNASYVKGDRHDTIKAAQQKLHDRGYKVVAHGVLDSKTEEALRLFQKKQHLPVTGVLDDESYQALTGHETRTITAVDKGLSAKVEKLLSEAHKYRGVPYSFGGSTPSGFDCSGYVRYVYSAIGIDLPRSADVQYGIGKKVEKKHLRPGDLVFFETYEEGVSHSGIYVGNNEFISATTSSGVVVRSLHDEYWESHYIGAKRIL